MEYVYFIKKKFIVPKALIFDILNLEGIKKIDIVQSKLKNEDLCIIHVYFSLNVINTFVGTWANVDNFDTLDITVTDQNMITNYMQQCQNKGYIKSSHILKTVKKLPTTNLSISKKIIKLCGTDKFEEAYKIFKTIW